MMKMEQINGANLLAMRSLAQQAEDSAITTRGNMEALVQHYVALQTENVKLRAQCQYMTEGMRDVFPQAHRLALELECLLLDTKDTAAVSKWWDSAHEALEQWREFCREDEKVGADGTAEDLNKCPQCGGKADNGHDRCIPPSAYMCSKCCAQEDAERAATTTHNG